MSSENSPGGNAPAGETHADVGAVPRREVLAWAMYDWANSAYSTLSITVLVAYLTADDVLPDDVGMMVWGYGIGGTMFVAALLSPVLGAVADAHASKRKWLAATAIPGSIAASLMFFATPDRAWLLVLLFLFANLCFELSLGFYNGFLPEIADDDRMSRVSSWGYALGYVGGGLALVLVIGLFYLGERMGIPSENHFRERLSLLFMGLWWGGFTVPTLLVLRDKNPPRSERQPVFKAARTAFHEVRTTLANIRRYRVLALFLLGFLIYNDGVQTVISQAGVFAGKVVQMETQELVQVVLMIQFIAFPGALLVDLLADRIGQKTTLLICLGVWTALLVAAFFIRTTTQFWIMAACAALVLGGTQSVSRTMMGLMTPRQHTAEFFGFFNLSGKATSVLGPVFFTAVLTTTGNPNLALSSLLAFFVLGSLIVAPLKIDEGRRQARVKSE